MRSEDSTSAQDATRRSFIVGTVGTAIAGAAVATTAAAAEHQPAGNGSVQQREGKRTMTNGKTEDGFVTAKDGVSIYYRDWDASPPQGRARRCGGQPIRRYEWRNLLHLLKWIGRNGQG